MTPAPKRPARRRLDPVERRLEILGAARKLFAQRGYPNVSTADLAEEAGVTRALVHHYFGSARGAYIEIGLEMVRELTKTLPAGKHVALATRVGRNLDALLDVVTSNEELWTATVSRAWNGADEELSFAVTAALATSVERVLGEEPGFFTDQPESHFALRAYVGLLVFACDLLIQGESDRESTHILLSSTLLDLMNRTIPKLKAAAGSGT